MTVHLHVHQPDFDTGIGRLPPASLRWIVFETNDWSVGENEYFETDENIGSINELLSQLPHLEKVVLEDRSILEPEEEVSDLCEEFAGLFPSVADKIHIRSEADALKYAQDAYDYGLPLTDQLPISPEQYVEPPFLCTSLTAILFAAGRKRVVDQHNDNWNVYASTHD